MSTRIDVDKALMQPRIIVAAMTSGIAILGVVATAIGTNTEPDTGLMTTLLVALGGLCAMEIPAFFIVRRVLIGKIQSEYQQSPATEDPTIELIPHFTTLTIIGGAMVESVSLFGCVIMLITGAWVALVAPALGFIVLSFLFPTRYRLAEFVARVTGRRW